MDDIDKLLKQLHNDVASEMKELTAFNYCPECGEKLEESCLFCPYCGADLKALQSQLEEQKPTNSAVSSPIQRESSSNDKEPIYKLPLYEGLEETTKIKISTFERLYKDTFEKETNRELKEYGAKGFESIDYAPLANLLTSALEIELYYSVFLMTRKLKGKRVFSYGDKLKLNLSKEKADTVYHDFILCLKLFSNDLHKKGLNDPKRCEILLRSIKTIRNKANHKGCIHKNVFFRLYDKIRLLFIEHMEQLINLKHQVENNEDPAPLKKGIIFTDIARLANKLSMPKVRNVLQEYIHQLKKMGIYYELFDCSEEFYTSGTKTWEDYAEALNNYCDATIPFEGQPIALFIVGGNDIIPMPTVQNPMPNILKEEEETIEADILYAYYEKGSVLTDLEGKVSFSAIRHRSPRFYVGRLPLEEGVEHLKPEAFIGYFSRAIDGHLGIDIKCHVPISCESAAEVSSSIIVDLPVFKQEDIPRFVEKDKIISPQMMVPFSSEEMNDPAFQYYVTILKRADMLTFNLHGSPVPHANGYYGERKDKRVKEEKDQPIVFIPQLLYNTSAKVITCMCCWGARFINFKREESTLLTALYDKVLLFMGSCRSAYGMFDIYIEDDKSKMSLSDLLIKYYMNYLFQGYDAGLALLKAKSEYLNYPDADFDKVMCAILEFNLFGDPMLYVKQQMDRKPVSQESDELNFVKRSYKLLFDSRKGKALDNNYSILEQLRSLVNCNLQDIREIVNKELYENYHVEPRSLKIISSYEDTEGKKGYNFVYHENYNDIDKYVYVDVDTKGNIQSIYGN